MPTYPIDIDFKPTGFASSVQIVMRLRAEGFRAFLVGGCVRDLWLKRDPKDFDIATSALPKEIRRCFSHTRAVGQTFGVIQVYLRGHAYEVATFREDGAYKDGRRPSSVTFGDEAADVQRRDFTINGLLFDPESSVVTDLVGGVDDLDRRLVRTIGDPIERFQEDSLRLLRAVRFAARLGFQIEPETARAISSLAGSMDRISPERILGELELILEHHSRFEGVAKLAELGLLEVIAPELEELRRDSRDRWSRNISVLGALPDRAGIGVAMAALCHSMPIEQIDLLLGRWRCSNEISDTIVELVEQQSWWLSGYASSRADRVRHLRQKRAPAHLTLLRANLRASAVREKPYRNFRKELDRLGPDDYPTSAPIDGNLLLSAGVPPGPLVGELLEEAQDGWLNRENTTTEEILASLRGSHSDLPWSVE